MPPRRRINVISKVPAGERLLGDYIPRKINSILKGEKIDHGSEAIWSNLSVNRGRNEMRQAL